VNQYALDDRAAAAVGHLPSGNIGGPASLSSPLPSGGWARFVFRRTVFVAAPYRFTTGGGDSWYVQTEMTRQ